MDPYGQYDSPYMAMGNSPIMLVDPDGGATSPIFDNVTGEFLGVDSWGFDKGDALFMDKNAYALLSSGGKNIIDHNVAVANSMSITGLPNNSMGLKLLLSAVNYMANVGVNSGGSVDFGGYNLSSQQLKDNLYSLSEYIGTQQGTAVPTVIVTGGNRSIARNQAVGGATKSRHLVGDAADIHVSGISNRQLSIYAHESALFNTVIYYPSIDATGALRPHVHVDLRSRTSPALLIYQPTVQNGAVIKHGYGPFKY